MSTWEHGSSPAHRQTRIPCEAGAPGAQRVSQAPRQQGPSTAMARACPGVESHLSSYDAGPPPDLKERASSCEA